MLPAPLALAQAVAPPPSLGEALLRRPLILLRQGDIIIASAHEAHRIITDGRNQSVVSSPDGKLIAFVRQDVLPRYDGDAGETSLRVAAVATGEIRTVLEPVRSGDPRRDIHAFDGPRWAPDGASLYVQVAAWYSGAAVHAVRLATGAERFVADGTLTAIVQSGPYRGDLLVRRHRDNPDGSAIDAVYLVQPDGRIVCQIVGNDVDGGLQSVPKWLTDNGWSAS